MGKILETILHGQKIGFHPQRVLLLPDLDTMLVADIHLGKAEFMQGKGIPLSNQPHQKAVSYTHLTLPTTRLV